MKQSEKIVNEIISDLTDRGGLDGAWYSIDEEIQEEIKETWIGIVEKHTNKTEGVDIDTPTIL